MSVDNLVHPILKLQYSYVSLYRFSCLPSFFFFSLNYHEWNEGTQTQCYKLGCPASFKRQGLEVHKFQASLGNLVRPLFKIKRKDRAEDIGQ